MENEQIKVAKIIISISEYTAEASAYIEQNAIYSHKTDDGTKAMDTSVIEYFKLNLGLLIGKATAEAVRIAVGSSFPEETELVMDVRGRDVAANVPRTISVTENQISEAISDVVKAIIENVKAAIEKMPKEAYPALKVHGITLKGKGAGLRNLDKRMMIETNLPVVISNETV